MRTLRVTLAATLLFSFSTSSFAQSAADYPSKPVRVVVPAGAGGGNDINARIVVQRLSEAIKRPFTIDNRPGGSGTIGYEIVAQAPPDGYTILAVGTSFTSVPALLPAFKYHPAKHYAPISQANRSYSMVLTHPAVPVKSMKELIALAKARPGALDWAVTNGTTHHLFSAYLTDMAKIKVNFIPYKGGSQDVLDLVSGQVQLVMGNFLSYAPLARAGKLRALAVTAAERAPAMPELPTISESGLPGYAASNWHGFVAPAGTPAAIVSKLSEEFARALRNPDAIKQLNQDGGAPIGSTPEQFRQTILEEIPRWEKVVKDSGMRVE
jgi:tripartite-type tricarboxylate transporter receptor subunit TctC